MRHQKKGRKFGKEKGPRKHFMRILLSNLITREKIETTLPRAKELKVRAEKLVTLAKKQTLHSMRLLFSRLPEKAAFKLFHEIAPRYKTRRGGYLRIVKMTEFRKRDGTEKAKITFV
jgi:large subunit ribosomal protein L17